MDMTIKNMPKRILLATDLSCILISYLLSSWIRFDSLAAMSLSGSIYGLSLIFILMIYSAVFLYRGFDSRIMKRGYLGELIAVAKENLLIAAQLGVIIYMFQKGTTYSGLFFLCFIILNLLITFIARLYYKVIFLSVYKNLSFVPKIMVITTSGLAQGLMVKIRRDNEPACHITYMTILDQDLVGRRIKGVKVKAQASDMFEVARKEALDGILIHIPDPDAKDINIEEMIRGFESMGLSVNISISTFGPKSREKAVQDINGIRVITFSPNIYSTGQLYLKRLLDILGGLVGSLITVVLTVLIAPAIYLESPGPVFFSQTRIGKNGRRFKIYKFRSMYMDAEERKAELMAQNEMNGLMFKMKDDPRVTKVGKFLRKTSLDEFPQFFNILKGDMSLVGTRPPTEAEFLEYEGWHRRRLTLKSGLTGLWQVSGRSDISDFDEVVKLDLKYIDNWSIGMDLKILLKTVAVVLFGKGAA